MITAEIGAPDLATHRHRHPVPLRLYRRSRRSEGLRRDPPGRAQAGQPLASPPLNDARNIYVARTYAYVSAGKKRIAIVDVEKPEPLSWTRPSTPAANSTTSTI